MRIVFSSPIVIYVVFAKVLKSTSQFSYTEKHFSNNTYPIGFSLALTTNTFFNTSHKMLFKKLLTPSYRNVVKAHALSDIKIDPITYKKIKDRPQVEATPSPEVCLLSLVSTPTKGGGLIPFVPLANA